MVVTNNYTAGDNQLHDSTITPQQELARAYYNKNIFMRVMKYHKWVSLQHYVSLLFDFVSAFICDKTRYTVHTMHIHKHNSQLASLSSHYT